MRDRIVHIADGAHARVKAELSILQASRQPLPYIIS